MQDTLRLFIAIELSQEIHQNLANLIQSLQTNSSRGINWVKPENIHLTLKFLGDTPRKQIRPIIDLLAQSTRDQSPIEMEVKGTGCFPSPRQPRVFWAGVETTDELAHLQQNIDSVLEEINIRSETQTFSPHLTLARVTDRCEPLVSQAIYQKLTAYNSSSFGKILVKRITLFQSTLTREGPIYSPQAYIPLHEIH